MSIAKNFKEPQKNVPREARLTSEVSAEKMISEMGLAKLRKALFPALQIERAVVCWTSASSPWLIRCVFVLNNPECHFHSQSVNPLGEAIPGIPTRDHAYGCDSVACYTI